jgi:hypothetical protein
VDIKSKRKLGRPPLPEHMRVRCVTLGVTVREDFALRVKAEACRLGLSDSAFLRHFIERGVASLSNQEGT